MDRLYAIVSHAKALRAIDADVRCYVLMDMRADPELSVELWKSAGMPCHRLWDGTALESHAEISPVLVEIDIEEYEEVPSHTDVPPVPDTPLARCLVRMDQAPAGRHAITWILSPKDGEELARHYRSYCGYDFPDGRGYYLHFYDARILAKLRLVWDAAQSAAFIGPAYEIHYCQRDGMHVAWKNEVSPAIEFEHGNATLVLTEQQHEALLQQDYPDKITLQLRRLYPALMGAVPHDALYGRVVTQLARARGHGVEHEQDLFDYVCCALTTSEVFDEHPRVRECFDRLKPRSTTLRELLAALPDEVWIDVDRIASLRCRTGHEPEEDNVHEGGPHVKGLRPQSGSGR